MNEFMPFDFSTEWRIPVLAALVWGATLLFTLWMGKRNKLGWFGKDD